MAYSEAVIGGRWEDIKNTKDRMFRQLSAELMNLVRIQFIISTAVYLLCVVGASAVQGSSGKSDAIYPCLAAGYFILFILYAEIIFLYYFNDLTGALLATLGFCLVTWAEACFLPAGVIFGTAWGWWRAALPVYHCLFQTQVHGAPYG